MRERAEVFRQAWADREPAAVANFLVDFDKTLAYLSIAFPEPFRGLIRTTNLLERFHKEIRRKQRDIGMFQSEQGCETLWYLLSRRETAKQRAILQSRSWEFAKKIRHYPPRGAAAAARRPSPRCPCGGAPAAAGPAEAPRAPPSPAAAPR